MKRSQVTSSVIKSLGYDKRGQILQVEFHDGSLWSYDGVTPEEYIELNSAPSIGSHYHKHIKGIKKGTKCIIVEVSLRVEGSGVLDQKNFVDKSVFDFIASLVGCVYADEVNVLASRIINNFEGEETAAVTYSVTRR